MNHVCIWSTKTNLIIAEDDKLRQDLEKVEQLESKIKTELSDLQSKIDQMTNDLGTYSNTEAQRREAEELKQVNYLRLSCCAITYCLL